MGCVNFKSHALKDSRGQKRGGYGKVGGHQYVISLSGANIYINDELKPYIPML